MSRLLRLSKGVAALLTVAVLAAGVRASAKPAGRPAAKANPVVAINVANRGTITVELYAKDAPKTVAHFLALCDSKFYNRILIHRVEPGFVVQAGEPKTRSMTGPALAAMNDDQKQAHGIGAGGSGKPVPFERNARTNEKGTVAMALAAPQSATGDSQWFINLAPNHRLDGDYCVFGKVIKGMSVVEKLKVGDRITAITRVKK